MADNSTAENMLVGISVTVALSGGNYSDCIKIIIIKIHNGHVVEATGRTLQSTHTMWCVHWLMHGVKGLKLGQ